MALLPLPSGASLNAYDPWGIAMGFQAKYRFSPELQSNLVLLADDEGRVHGNIDSRYAWDSGSMVSTTLPTPEARSTSKSAIDQCSSRHHHWL